MRTETEIRSVLRALENEETNEKSAELTAARTAACRALRWVLEP